MAGISGSMSNMTNLIGKINGSMTSALSFQNVKLNVFGCELAPTPAVSDYYTFCTGGSGVKDTKLPSLKKVEDAANNPPKAKEASKIPFVEPTKLGTQDLNNPDVSDAAWDETMNLSREDIMNDPNIEFS